ncbi:MAG: ATP-binding cassette domain-containing protein, partial [Chloroflexaceae bacterium]|nr:ATP-binding cassette domain-containing protein [Chloroflexaceae bacterium]
MPPPHQPPPSDETMRLAAPRMLQIVSGAITLSYPLTTPTVTLGRSADNQIVLPFRTVSRRHAVLTLGPHGYTIYDQHTPNGLLYRGQRIDVHLLADGDVLRIADELGNVITLHYYDHTHPALRPVQMAAFAPAQDALTIGRNPTNDIVLDSPLVSARHTLLRRTASGPVLEDLGSTNGTYLRGERVRRAALAPGDVIQIAGYQLVYQEDGLLQRATVPAVRLDALGLSNPTTPRLNGVSLTIAPEQLVAIVGPSGSGKSTLLRALGGITPAQAGRVLVNNSTDIAAYRGSIGYVPQAESLHPELTVEGTLHYGARLRLPPDFAPAEVAERISAVLKEVELVEQRQRTVAQLSGGQRRRLAIALELLARPGLLLLDEPATGLDPARS